MDSIKHSREANHSLTYFSERDQAYMKNPGQFKNFIDHAPEVDSFSSAIAAKQASFSSEARKLLINRLRLQYDSNEIESPTGLDLLAQENSVAVVTAHQPCLFTGPLYFIYKIASAIALARKIENQHPDVKVVPMYVLGNEDHDFEEINHFRIFGKTLSWETTQTGAVGAMTLEGVQDLIDQLEEMLGTESYAEGIISLLRKSYQPNFTLTQGTTKFVHGLFGDHGLIVADLDDPELKKSASFIFEKEINEQYSKKLTHDNQSELETLGFSAQIYSRDINLFYLNKGIRERIELVDGELRTDEFVVTKLGDNGIDTDVITKISPNVVLRPLYQQYVLPSIAYVGGGAEVAYWMEINGIFKYLDIPFPMLVRRDSALYINNYVSGLMQKLNLSTDEIFTDLHKAQEFYLKSQADADWSLNAISEAFNSTFNDLTEEIKKQDEGLTKMVKGFQTQHDNFINKLESKIKKSIKNQHDVAMGRIEKVWNELFPDRSLQERKDNFIPIYAKQGPAFITKLVEAFDPLEIGMHIFIEE